MSKKVLIIGAKGMLGQALLQEFIGATGWDREEIDIANYVEVREKIKKFAPDVLINAAAYNAVDKIEEDVAAYDLARKINGEAVGELAKIAKEIGAIFVHYSTDYVFDGDSKEGYAENATPCPLSKYGETKFLGEKLLQEFGEKYYLIRLSRFFGKSGTGEGTKKSFVEVMLDLYNQGRHEFDLVDEELSSPTYAPDAAQFTHELIESWRPWGIYHGNNAGTCTWHGFSQEIFKIKNLEPKLNAVASSKFPRPAKRPQFSVLINTKMPGQRSWQEALKEYLFEFSRLDI